jgi:hypothetical protein
LILNNNQTWLNLVLFLIFLFKNSCSVLRM